jgi:hypothetical protein
MDYRVAGYPTCFRTLALLVLFALVFFRWHDAIVYCVSMEHYRTQVEEKEAKAPTGRCECSQQHEDPNWDRTKHPEKARKLVSLVNMSQAGNDTKDNCDGVAGFALRRLIRATCPITPVAACGIFRKEMSAVWTGNFISSARFRLSDWCIRVLYAHF